MGRRENISSLRRPALAVVALLLPLAAGAQQAPSIPGIDLTEPPAQPGQKAPPAPAKPEVRAPDFTGDAALADRVKAVQRKGFLKRGRLELEPMVQASLNDAFYQKVGLGGRLAWNIRDSFAVAVRGTYWLTLRTDHIREGQAALQSQLLSSRPVAQAMVDGIWSPIYGKASWMGSNIVHFDLFVLGGLGGVWSDTSLAPRSEGAHPAVDLGGGIRFYPTDWLALELGVLATLYPDRASETAPSTTTKIVTASVGVSFFWPFSFEYVYP